MIKKKDNLRKIPKRNYFISIAIFVIVVGLIFYATETYKINEEKKLSQSTLSGYCIGELKFDEIDTVFAEVSSDYFVYISYLDSNEIHNFERKLKYVINDYNLQDEFYYLNVTEEKNDKKITEKLNTKFELHYNKIEKLPAILYYKEGYLQTILTSNNNLISMDDFKALLEHNGYQKK